MSKTVMTLVNNTCLDIRGFVEAEVWAAAREGRPLSDDIADLFVLDVREVDGEVVAFLNMA